MKTDLIKKQNGDAEKREREQKRADKSRKTSFGGGRTSSAALPLMTSLSTTWPRSLLRSHQSRRTRSNPLLSMRGALPSPSSISAAYFFFFSSNIARNTWSNSGQRSKEERVSRKSQKEERDREREKE